MLRIPHITLLIVLTCLNFSFGQNELPALTTDRPDQTESPYTVPVGSFQIETGIVLAKDKPDGADGSATINSYDFGSTLLRYGLIPDLELRLAGSFLREDVQLAKSTTSEGGLSDIRFGVKYQLSEANGLIPDAGVIASLKFPVGHKYFTSDKIVPGINFAASHPLTSFWSLGYNLGFRYQDKAQNIFFYTLATAVQPLQKIGIFVEVFGASPEGIESLHQADLGMTYLVLPNFQLDTSYGFSLNDPAPDSFFNVGLSWRLPR